MSFPIQTGLPGALQTGATKKTGMHDAQLARALVRAANPMLIIDRGSNILWCNEAYAHLVATPPELLIKKKPACLAPTRERSKFLSEIWAVLMGGEIWKGELSERKADGTTVHVDAVMTPLDDAYGAPVLFMLFLHDITERKNEYDNIWRMANHDRLTGLANRSFFLSMLDRTLATAVRNKGRCGLLYLDLDGFKQANDTYGHDVGDLVLIEAAKIMSASVRRSDFVARLGGDEFVCILSEIAQDDDAGEVASKIISAIGQMQEVDGKKVKIGASIGVSLYPNDGVDGPSLIKASDRAMYAAKKAGKNCWRRAVDADPTESTEDAPR